jgi:hypothetical protein
MRWGRGFMIKVGFICEGFTEKILLESSAFKALLAGLNIEPVHGFLLVVNNVSPST